MALLLCSTLAATPSAHAINWFADEVTVKTESDPNIGFMPVCGYYPLLPVFLTVAKQASPWDSSESVNASGCIEFGKNADMARYFTNTFWTQTRAVRIHGDATFHDYVGPEGVILPESDTQVLTASAGTASAPKTRLYTTRNFSTTLKPMMRNSQGVVTSYSTDLTKLETWMWDESDTSKQHSVVPATVSENGRYVIAYVDNKGYVKIDLDRRTVTKILDRVVPSDKPYVTLWNHVGGVSSEGRYVVVGDFQNDATLIVDTENCGDEFGRGFVAPMKSVCRTLDLEKLAEQKTGKKFNGFSKKTFLKDGSLTLESSDVSSGAKMRLTLQKYGHIEPALYYLALGDSYSSGEGDIDKKPDGSSYYVAGTEDVGMCHTSTRSYPFLLRDAWKFSTDKGQSVACSGAMVSEDYTVSVESYIGQHNELLNQSTEGRQGLIDAAYEYFVPGRIPQVEFVKKYKPKVLTITGSGNDVGFAKILEYCAADIEQLVFQDYSCEYVEGAALNQMLNDAIDTQYSLILRLLKDIKQASPDTKVYYIGYPSFIGGSDSFCALNSAILDKKERDMINDAVHRLNGVIRAAASASGVAYVDIEDSLVGGRLCEGSDYMTGPWNTGLKAIVKKELNELFHPNAKGHQMIANKILEKVKDPIVNHNVEMISRVVKPVTVTKQVDMVTGVVMEGEVLRVELQPSTLASSSVVVTTGFSQPVHLGNHLSEADGSLRVDIKIPESMKAGRHVLTLEGKGHDGTPIRLFQYITVQPTELARQTESTNNLVHTTPSIGSLDTLSGNNAHEMPRGVLQMSQGRNATGLLSEANREKNIKQRSTVFSHETLPSFNNWLTALCAGAILVLISIGVVYYHVKNHKN